MNEGIGVETQMRMKISNVIKKHLVMANSDVEVPQFHISHKDFTPLLLFLSCTHTVMIVMRLRDGKLWKKCSLGRCCHTHTPTPTNAQRRKHKSKANNAYLFMDLLSTCSGPQASSIFCAVSVSEYEYGPMDR